MPCRSRAAFRQLRGLRSEQRGAVTVEAAISIAALVSVLALSLFAVAAITSAVRCNDAAREAARLAARGEPAAARLVATTTGPAEATVRFTRTQGRVRVVVRAPAAGPVLSAVTVRGSAVAALEPGVGDGRP